MKNDTEAAGHEASAGAPGSALGVANAEDLEARQLIRKAAAEIRFGRRVMVDAAELAALRAVAKEARSSYDVNDFPAEEGDLYKALAALDALSAKSPNL